MNIWSCSLCQAGLLMEDNARRLRRLKEYSDQIKDSHLVIMDQNFNSTQLLKDAQRFLLNTGLNFDVGVPDFSSCIQYFKFNVG